MQDDKAPGFLSTFVGALFNFGEYPRYSRSSGGSLFLHYLLLITVCCLLYAGASQVFTQLYVSPVLATAADQIPAISVIDGQATVDIEQPHFYEIEGETFAVIDTINSPDTYLDKYDAVAVLSKDKFIIKNSDGRVREQPLPKENFSPTSDQSHEWLKTAEEWVFPSIFLLCFVWQVCWKAVQVLLVAGVVTLIQKSRPDFSVHLKLATLALGPAMLFGVLVYVGFIFTGVSIPASGLIFWAILGGLTYYGSDKLRKSPTHS